MVKAYLNCIATAVPDHDLHQKFIDYALNTFQDDHGRALFKRMASRAQIEHRYSFLKPHEDSLKIDTENFYERGHFPSTEKRMRFYEHHAFELAKRALDSLHLEKISATLTHLIITTCTGFYAPGLDFQIMEHYGLRRSIERTMIGFMGCYAGLNALKTARHIVRSDPSARVLVVNLELCTLHLKETHDLDQMLSFLIFADGCSASIVSAEPVGLEIKSFHAALLPDSNRQITWHIRESGFDMILSGQVPQTIHLHLPSHLQSILNGKRAQEMHYWAIHPGGRSVLDAVQKSIHLSDHSILPSRAILRQFGNMSSATILFVLKEIMNLSSDPGEGCAMAFGPGLTVETMLFQKV